MSFKKKLIDISSIGTADILASGIAALFWFYIASTLGPEDYGNVTYLISIASLASGISLFGSNYTLMVYSAKKIEIQSSLYLISLVAGIVSSIIVFFYFQNIGISFVVLGFIILGLVSGDLIGKKFYKKYSKQVLIQKALLVILGIGLYHLIGEVGIFIGIALSHSVLIIEIVKRFRDTKIDFKLVKEKKKFILNNFGLSVTGTIYSSLDKLIIAPILGFTILGNYSLGLQFFAILLLLPSVFQKYLVPQDSTGVENKKLKKLVILISFCFAILGSFVGPIVISSIFPKFIEAEEIIRIISWAIIPHTINSVYYLPKFWAKEMNSKIVFSSVSSTLSLILGIITLGTSLGVNGVAISFVLSASIGVICSALLDRYKN